jgi:hypothetical protein
MGAGVADFAAGGHVYIRAIPSLSNKRTATTRRCWRCAGEPSAQPAYPPPPGQPGTCWNGRVRDLPHRPVSARIYDAPGPFGTQGASSCTKRATMTMRVAGVAATPAAEPVPLRTRAREWRAISRPQTPGCVLWGGDNRRRCWGSSGGSSGELDPRETKPRSAAT